MGWTDWDVRWYGGSGGIAVVGDLFTTQCFFKRWQIGFDGAPEDGFIGAAVVVDEDVAHGDDGVPGDLRVFVLGVGGQFGGGFADDGEAADDGVLDERVDEESAFGDTVAIAFDERYGRENVVDAVLVRFAQRVFWHFL